MAKIRLDKYLADMQIGTRSAVKEYIRKGRVRVNEAVVKSPEQKIDTETDAVLYDDKPVNTTRMNTLCLINRRAWYLQHRIQKKRL